MKNKLLIRSSFSTLLLLSSLTAVTSCSKKEEGGQASSSGLSVSEELSPIRSSSVLSYLPQNSLGFYTLDLSLDSAKKFLATAWSGQNLSISDSINKIVAESGTDFKEGTFVTELDENGLLPTGKGNSKISRFLVSFSVEKDAAGVPTPGLVILEELNAGQDAGALLPGIESKLKAKGIKTTALTQEGAKGFSFPVVLDAKEEKKAITINVSIVAHGPRLEITSSPSLINNEFLLNQPSKSTRLAELKADAEYKRALGSIPATQSEFAFGYFDVQKTVGVVASVAPDTQEVKDAIAKIPVKAALVIRDMNDSLVDRGAVTFTTDSQPSMSGLDELAQNSPSTFASTLPKELVAFLSLDGALIRSIGKSVVESSPPDKKAEAQGIYDQVKSVAEIGLAVRPQQGASPLPEVAILVTSTEADQMAQNASDLISLGAGSQGFLPPFQKKEIEGVQVQYALSPFGAGVYLCSSDGQVILSSSEAILSEIIKNRKNKSGGALEDLTAQSKSLLSSANSLALVYVNYSRVATLIESLSASLGIFTGGQPLVEASVLETLRKYGQSSTSLAFSNRILQFVNRTEVVAPKA